MHSGHSAHDYRALTRRWRGLVKPLGAKLDVLYESDGFPVHVIRTKVEGEGGFYASAGIHGDEPAGAWGLLDFVEHNTAKLAALPATIVPCLNPWGFTQNIRSDASGRDLNRAFLRDRDPRIRAWKTLFDGWWPDLSLCFHEDYDALGTYIYEHGRGRDPVGWNALAAAAEHIAPDPRKKIEGKKADGGLIWIRRLPDFGDELPEGIALHRIGSKRSLTTETPSELDLGRRVAAHRAIAEAAFGTLVGPS